MKKILFLVLSLLALVSTLFAQGMNFQSRGVGGGGALFFPRINPGNDKEYYVSCDMSQLFHSTDFGEHYDQIPFQTLQVFGANSTYEWTNDPNVAYCNFNDGNNGYPVRTMDGGQSWQPLPGHDPNNENVYRMAANYQKPNQLLLNYYGDIFISNDFGNTLQLVKHAANNGVGLIMGGTFFDGNNIYIGTNEGIFSSSNGGNSFSLMPASGLAAGQVIWSFAAGKSNGVTRFTCITADASDVYNGVMPWEYWGFAKGVYTMENASGTWTAASTGIDFNSDFIMYVGMAWNDAQTIYLGGNDGDLGAPLVMKSENGGGSWTKVFKTTNNENIITGWSGYQGDKFWSWGETCFGITVAPTNSQKVMFGDFGFVHVTENGGTSWRQAYVDKANEHPAGVATPKYKAYASIGLENTTCWQVFWLNPDIMLGAYSDIGMIRSKNAGKTWGFDYTDFVANSTYRIIKSSAQGYLYAATSGVHDMYQSTRLTDAILDANDNAGKIYLSFFSDGQTWSVYQPFGHPVYWLAENPANGTLYASVVHYGGGGANMKGGIYQQPSGGTWTQLPPPPRTEGHPGNIIVLNDGKVLCTFSGRRNASGQFTASSGVYLYDPATGAWSDRSATDMYYWTKDVVVDPADPTQNTWFVGVFSGWGGAPNGKGGLYRSIDRGLHWTKLTGTQFDRVTSLTFNPLQTNQAYLTTETQGLWVSNNIHAATPDWNLVEAYPFRQPERVYFNPYKPGEMWVSSFGNGMRVTQLATDVQETAATGATLHVWPNPAEDILHVEMPDNDEGGILSIHDLLGRPLWSGAPKSSEKEMRISTINWAPGVYILQYGERSEKIVIK